MNSQLIRPTTSSGIQQPAIKFACLMASWAGDVFLSLSLCLGVSAALVTLFQGCLSAGVSLALGVHFVVPMVVSWGISLSAVLCRFSLVCSASYCFALPWSFFVLCSYHSDSVHLALLVFLVRVAPFLLYL